ncbi:MAG TPA: MFS transporter [Microvirga sp.]|jgi:PPP family 3-phenylpropionic acid transporter|nr:MFS transporter [Microvirga sp.]
MHAPSTLGFRLSALHAASFTGIGVHLSFFPVWLQSRAMSPTTIGLVIAIPIVVRILAAAPLLALADRHGPRRLLIACHAAQAVLYPALFFIGSEVGIMAVVALIAVVQAPVMAGNDLATTNAIRDGAHLNYGRVRGWGSIAFLIASIAAGYLVDARGAQAILWALALSPLLALATTMLALPSGPPVARIPGVPEPAPGPRSVPRVLWLVMAAAATIQASHGAIYAFGSIHWRGIGFSDAAIGYLWAIGVVAEIAVFYCFGQMVGRARAALGLIMLGGAAVVVRFAAMAFDPNLPLTFALQALHGLTFGATHLGTMAALAAFAPAAARGRAQGLFSSASAFGQAAATLASGPIYRAEGAMVFAAMVPLGIIGLGFAIWAARAAKDAEAGSPADGQA